MQVSTLIIFDKTPLAQLLRYGKSAIIDNHYNSHVSKFEAELIKRKVLIELRC